MRNGGTIAPRHLIGAFAFALCDLREAEGPCLPFSDGREVVVLLRESPLFAFASAAQGVFALPFVPREINRQSVADFLV